MAAVLTSDMQNTDKVVTFIEECREMGLELILPDVNQSQFGFTVNDDNAIVYGLGAVKGVGEGPDWPPLLRPVKTVGRSRIYSISASASTVKKLNKRVIGSTGTLWRFDRLAVTAPRAVLMASLRRCH